MLSASKAAHFRSDSASWSQVFASAPDSELMTEFVVDVITEDAEDMAAIGYHFVTADTLTQSREKEWTVYLCTVKVWGV